MKTDHTPTFAAHLGIDWGNSKHDLCLQPADGGRRELSQLQHTPEAIADWARGLRKRFDGRPIAVAVELTRGPIVSALRRYDFFVVFPIHPSSLAKYRETWSPSGAKDDPSDAALALDMLQRHPERLKPLRPQSEDMRALTQLVEARRKLVADRVRITNRIVAGLKEYFPQPMQWFEDRGTLLFCDFLSRWNCADSARRARVDTLERFFKEHHVNNPDTLHKRIQDIKKAQPLTRDAGVVVPAKLLVATLVAQLRAVIEGIKHYDQNIEQIAKRHDDYAIFRSFPAAGTVFAPRLMAAFGEDRARYQNPGQVQRYAGTAPVTERSGQMHWVHWRFKAPAFLRQTFVEWAALTIPHSFWASAHYRQQRDKGKTHQAALRSLAFKWTRILFRCWQDRTTYDETRYLMTLRKRGSSLVATTAFSTAQP